MPLNCFASGSLYEQDIFHFEKYTLEEYCQQEWVKKIKRIMTLVGKTVRVDLSNNTSCMAFLRGADQESIIMGDNTKYKIINIINIQEIDWMPTRDMRWEYALTDDLIAVRNK